MASSKRCRESFEGVRERDGTKEFRYASSRRPATFPLRPISLAPSSDSVLTTGQTVMHNGVSAVERRAG